MRLNTLKITQFRGSSIKLIIMKRPQTELRREKIGIIGVIFVSCVVFLFLSASSGRHILSNLIIFFGGLGVLTCCWVAFFSQFVLPLRRLNDRKLAVQRLLGYILGQAGPAIFISDGKVEQRRGESQRRGSGVILLDSASGAVLRNDVAFTRVVGPGLVFTKKGEYVAGAVDLHLKTYPIPPLGPLGNEDPFASSRRSDQTDEEYAQIQTRRLETSGLTRDGVEVVPNVMVTFRPERLPGDVNIGFGFNPAAVEAWVRAEGIAKARADERRKPEESTPGEGKTTRVLLDRLPAYLAVDVWREYLQKFTLGELFLSPLDENNGKETGLETILRMVNQRLTHFEVEELDHIGKPTGRRVRSKEFNILQDCGIRVEEVSIYNLRFKPEVERRLVDDWIATWLERARAERDRIEALRNMRAMDGRQAALLRFAAACTRRLDTETLSLPRPSDEGELFFQMKLTLDRLLRGTLQECFLDPRLQAQIGGNLNLLSEVINWVRVREP